MREAGRGLEGSFDAAVATLLVVAIVLTEGFRECLPAALEDSIALLTLSADIDFTLVRLAPGLLAAAGALLMSRYFLIVGVSGAVNLVNIP